MAGSKNSIERWVVPPTPRAVSLQRAVAVKAKPGVRMTSIVHQRLLAERLNDLEKRYDPEEDEGQRTALMVVEEELGRLLVSGRGLPGGLPLGDGLLEWGLLAERLQDAEIYPEAWEWYPRLVDEEAAREIEEMSLEEWMSAAVGLRVAPSED